jgi:hypothetical protein
MDGKWRPNIVSSSATVRMLMVASLHFYTNSSPVNSQFPDSTPTSCDLSPQYYNSVLHAPWRWMANQWGLLTGAQSIGTGALRKALLQRTTGGWGEPPTTPKLSVNCELPNVWHTSETRCFGSRFYYRLQVTITGLSDASDSVRT